MRRRGGGGGGSRRKYRADALTGPQGESLHYVLLLDYVPTEEPLGTPLGNTLRIRRPKPDWRGP